MNNMNNNNTNNNSTNTNYHKLILVSIEEARDWYRNSNNDILKTLALRAFTKEELENSFRDIKSFKGACNALGLDYDDLDSVITNMIIFGHSRASAAMFKLNIIRKALNFNYNLDLTNDSSIYYPINPFVNENSVYWTDDISSGKVEIIGKIKYNGVIYNILSGQSFICGTNNGLGDFNSDKDWKGYWRNFYIDIIKLPKGSIKKLIGRDLNYDDEPVELI